MHKYKITIKIKTEGVFLLGNKTIACASTASLP